MKNFILLFLFGFALTWVGCEKETIMPDAADTLALQSQLNSTEYAHAVDAPVKPEQTSNSDLCCALGSVDMFEFNFVDAAERVFYTYDYKVPAGPEAFRMTNRIFANGTLVDVVTFVETDPNVCTEDIFGYFVEYSKLGECPDYIRIFAMLEVYEGGWQRCATQEYAFSSPHVYNLDAETPCSHDEANDDDDLSCEPFC